MEIKKGIVERTKYISVDEDADMGEVMRFLKSTIPKVALPNPVGQRSLRKFEGGPLGPGGVFDERDGG